MHPRARGQGAGTGAVQVDGLREGGEALGVEGVREGRAPGGRRAAGSRASTTTAFKSRAWRSRILKAEDIAEISVRRFRSVWLSRDILRSPPLAFGLVRPGTYIKPVTGRSYFFRSRDTEELAEVLTAWWVEGVEPATPSVK